MKRMKMLQEVIMTNLQNTQFFQVETGPQVQAKDILEIVYLSLIHI